jgi:hypothetical protein
LADLLGPKWLGRELYVTLADASSKSAAKQLELAAGEQGTQEQSQRLQLCNSIGAREGRVVDGRQPGSQFCSSMARLPSNEVPHPGKSSSSKRVLTKTTECLAHSMTNQLQDFPRRLELKLGQ